MRDKDVFSKGVRSVSYILSLVVGIGILILVFKNVGGV